MLADIHLVCAMINAIVPPAHVKGMRTFDIDKFTTSVTVPVVNVTKNDVQTVNAVLKNYVLKLPYFKSISNNYNVHECYFFLDPAKVCALPDLSQWKTFVTPHNLNYAKIWLGYNNWSHDQVIKAILPKNMMLSSFSEIGSIVHVNLKKGLLAYRYIIGRVLYDKIKGCKSVVNKVAAINNVYRNFNYEVLYGSKDLKTTVRESNCTFDLDLARVFWNPRLSTEHKRILKKLKYGDILYDVFAGIGPFSVPAAKMGCWVLANDLNPNCCKWLKVNKIKNKIRNLHLRISNKHGRQFIEIKLKKHLNVWSKRISSNNTVHVTMNLPETALGYVKYFYDLLDWEEVPDHALPILHVYTYVYTFPSFEEGLKSVMNVSLSNLKEENIQEIYRVRQVAPYKEIVRISFQTTREMLITPETEKKRKLDENVNATSIKSKEIE